MKLTWSLPVDGTVETEALTRLREDILRRAADGVAEAIRDASLGVGTFSWVDDGALNAEVSAAQKGAPAVRVNVGSMLQIFTAFLALLSEPEFLPSVPLSDRTPYIAEFARLLVRAHVFGEREELIVTDTESDAAPHHFLGVTQQLADRMNFLIVAPDDEQRSRVAIALACVALDFVLWHEFAHVGRGHLKLVPRRTLSMFPQPTPEEERLKRLLRVLELDADTCALLGLASTLVEEGYGLTWRPMPDVFDTPDRIMKYMILSLGVLFVLCSHGPEASDDHPSPELRYWNAFNTLGGHFAQTVDDGERRWSAASQAALEELDRLALAYGFPCFDFEASRRRVEAELGQLDAELAVLEPELDGYVRLDAMKRAVREWSQRRASSDGR